jgi:hypothetical protein
MGPGRGIGIKSQTRRLSSGSNRGKTLHLFDNTLVRVAVVMSTLPKIYSIMSSVSVLSLSSSVDCCKGNKMSTLQKTTFVVSWDTPHKNHRYWDYVHLTTFLGMSVPQTLKKMKPCLRRTRHFFDIVEAGLDVTISKFVLTGIELHSLGCATATPTTGLSPRRRLCHKP